MGIFEIKDNFKELESIESKAIRLSEVEHPQFTITIPSYKRGVLIKASLHSALNQDTQTPYEVIVIDNDSTPDSETERFIQTIPDSRLSYYKNEPNAGMVGNHNLCFKLSRTRYVVILHDDDILLPFALRMYERVMKETGDFGMIASDDYIMKDNVKPTWSVPEKLHLKRHKLLYNFVRFHIQEPSGTLYDKDKMEKIGGYQPEFYPCFDYSGALLMLDNYPVYTLSEKFLIYRYDDNASLNPKTILLSLEKDYWIRKELGEKLGLPKWIVRFVLEILSRSRLNSPVLGKKNKYYTIDGKRFEPLHFIGKVASKLLYLTDNFIYSKGPVKIIAI